MAMPTPSSPLSSSSLFIVVWRCLQPHRVSACVFECVSVFVSCQLSVCPHNHLAAERGIRWWLRFSPSVVLKSSSQYVQNVDQFHRLCFGRLAVRTAQYVRLVWRHRIGRRIIRLAESIGRYCNGKCECVGWFVLKGLDFVRYLCDKTDVNVFFIFLEMADFLGVTSCHTDYGPVLWTFVLAEVDIKK